MGVVHMFHREIEHPDTPTARVCEFCTTMILTSFAGLILIAWRMVLIRQHITLRRMVTSDIACWSLEKDKSRIDPPLCGCGYGWIIFIRLIPLAEPVGLGESSGLSFRDRCPRLTLLGQTQM